MSHVDSDGFLVGNGSSAQTVIAAPQVVAVPKFFEGCLDLKEAAIRALNELAKPYSREIDGIDEMYQRLSNALVVLLANIAGVEP